MSCGAGHRHGPDPALLWLWCRLAAAALIRPLAQEVPRAKSAALKKKKRKEKVFLEGRSQGFSGGCLGTAWERTSAALFSVFIPRRRPSPALTLGWTSGSPRTALVPSLLCHVPDSQLLGVTGGDTTVSSRPESQGEVGVASLGSRTDLMTLGLTRHPVCTREGAEISLKPVQDPVTSSRKVAAGDERGPALPACVAAANLVLAQGVRGPGEARRPQTILGGSGRGPSEPAANPPPPRSPPPSPTPPQALFPLSVDTGCLCSPQGQAPGLVKTPKLH